MKKVYFAAREIEIRVTDESDTFEEKSQIRTFLKNSESKYDNIFIFEEKEEGIGLDRVIDLTEFYQK